MYCRTLFAATARCSRHEERAGSSRGVEAAAVDKADLVASFAEKVFATSCAACRGSSGILFKPATPQRWIRKLRPRCSRRWSAWTTPEARLISPETRNALNRRLLPADELAKIDEIEPRSNMRRRRSRGKQEIQAHLASASRQFAALAPHASQSKTGVWLTKDRGGNTIVMLPEPGKTTFTSAPRRR